MASRHFPVNGGWHLSGRFRFALGSQTAGYRFKIGLREPCRWTKQDAVAGFFDREFGARDPSPRDSDTFRQDDLPFCRKTRGLHK
jgi:hypothetical protein